ncbi:Hpt domain-containing protein [uncultured Pseudodesulfovibrio sp.]|uniref:Hpt domain-containing protein n=1 Tax=uncultured Pseudodesulfovibrio sp. TaxID=2035858 RepID=UPI0029C88042|nr:Hpt domain-containing protein [uncultured Pseudodesulfovibrio sp.]
MTGTPIVERIDPELEELMERFFINSRADLAEMESSLESGDFETLSRLGHTAKGTGYGYGLLGMGEIGKELEQTAKSGDIAASRILVERMSHYLDNVRVEYGE